MPNPLPALVHDRSTLLQRIAQLGDFQPGSITSATRRCGSPACHCAQPNDPGHGPYFQLTQKVEGQTVTQNLASPAAVRKAESEVAEFRKFQTWTVRAGRCQSQDLPLAARGTDRTDGP